MALPQSPLHIFSSSVEVDGQIRVELQMPWPVPWAIGALRTAIAWELAACCEQWQRLAARVTNQELEPYKREFESDHFRWLDGTFNKNADRILDHIADELSRVQPRPILVITGPEQSDGDREALNELGRLLNIEIKFEEKFLPDDTSDDAKAAVRLLGSAGLINANTGSMLIQAVHKVGDASLMTALSHLIGRDGNGIQSFSAYKVSTDDARLLPVFKEFGLTTLRQDLPDWQSLELSALMQELWKDPMGVLDRIRAGSTPHLKSERNAFHIRVRIARHYLRCFVNQGLAARLDLLEASVESWNKHPEAVWRLLNPHLEGVLPERDAIIVAHIYGQAGQAASKLGRPLEALQLYERNLACLGLAFGPDSLTSKKARAGLEHKIGQLIREHPELPGGFTRARRHIEDSLRLHEELGIVRGVSMCLSEMGELSVIEGLHDEAKLWFDKALNADRRAGNVDGETRVLHQLAAMFEHLGDFDKALSYVEQCERAQQTGGVSYALRQQVRNTRERIQHLLGVDDNIAGDDFLAALTTSVDEDPRTFTTRVTQRARILREQGRFLDAETLLRQALKRSIPETHNLFVLMALVSLLLDLQRYEEVRAAIQGITPSDLGLSAELTLVNARLEYQTGNYEQAEAIIASLGDDTSPEIKSRRLMLRGRIHHRQRRFEEAAACFRESRTFSQSSPYALGLSMELEAHSYLLGGKYNEAAEMARTLINATAAKQWKTRHIRALAMLGDALMCQGQMGNAAGVYEQAIEIAQGVDDVIPFSQVALERRAARAWLNAGNGNMALLRIRNAIEQLDHEAAPLGQRGWIYHLAAIIHRRNGSHVEYEAAVSVAEKCALDSNDDPLLHALSIVRQGDLRQDDWQIDDLGSDEADVPQVIIGRARRLRQRRKLDEALNALASIEHSPIREPVRQELLELKLGIMLDLKEVGREADVRELMEQLAAGRSDSEFTPKLLLLKARAELLCGGYQAAIDLTRLAYEKATSHGEFFSVARAGAILSRTLAETGHQREAVSTLLKIAHYMEVHDRRQFAFDAKYSASRHLIDMRLFDEARKHLEALDNSSPASFNLADWARIQIAYASIERIDGLHDAAISRLDNVLERVSVEGRHDLKGEAERLRQAVLVDSGRVQHAVQSTHNSETGYSNAVKAASSSVKALRLSGRHKEAITVAEQELARIGSTESRLRAIALHNAAQAYYQDKRFNKAEELCRQSLELHIKLGIRSGVPGARITLANILARTAREEEARQQAHTALAENIEALDKRGIEICERFLARLSGEDLVSGRPEYARDMLNRAQALRRAGRTDEAFKVMTEALPRARLEQDEITEAKVLGALGITSFKIGDFNQAIEHLRRAVDLHSRKKSAYMGECSSYLARSYSQLGQNDEATTVLNEALQYARMEQDMLSEAKALGALGIMSFMANDFFQAADHLEKAVEIHCSIESEHIGECTSYLTRSYSQLGRDDEARRLIAKVLGGSRLKPKERERLEQLLLRLG